MQCKNFSKTKKKIDESKTTMKKIKKRAKAGTKKKKKNQIRGKSKYLSKTKYRWKLQVIQGYSGSKMKSKYDEILGVETVRELERKERMWEKTRKKKNFSRIVQKKKKKLIT